MRDVACTLTCLCRHKWRCIVQGQIDAAFGKADLFWKTFRCITFKATFEEKMSLLLAKISLLSPLLRCVGHQGGSRSLAAEPRLSRTSPDSSTLTVNHRQPLRVPLMAVLLCSVVGFSSTTRSPTAT